MCLPVLRMFSLNVQFGVTYSNLGIAGPISKHDHVGEAVRVAGPSYPQSCSMTPARPLGGPVMTLPEPVIMASSRGRDDSMCISHQSHGRRFRQDCSVGVSVEVDLRADPSDKLGLSPDRPEILDDFDDAQHYVTRFQDDLPADPMEGLAIPSWHELLDEAATQLTPQGFPRTGPALTPERFDRNSPAPGTNPSQGFPGPSPALTDSPARKRQKQSIMQESGRQPSWILDLDTKQISSGVDLDSMLPCVGKAFKLPERMAIPSSQRSMPRSEAQGSDAQTQDRRSPSHSVETITVGQAAQHETKSAVVQAGKGSKAKRAKRGATGRKVHTAAAGQGRGQGQGQTVGANGKACTAPLGMVLPFNTLKVRLCLLYAYPLESPLWLQSTTFLTFCCCCAYRLVYHPNSTSFLHCHPVCNTTVQLMLSDWMCCKCV